jgi:hypothetical protein
MYTETNMVGTKKRPGTEHPGWGGRREGSGRPRMGGAAVFARLTESEITALHAIGDGSVSLGVQRLLRGQDSTAAGQDSSQDSTAAGKRIVKFVLSPDDIEQVRELGQGNASEGIRQLVRRHQSSRT